MKISIVPTPDGIDWMCKKRREIGDPIFIRVISRTHCAYFLEVSRELVASAMDAGLTVDFHEDVSAHEQLEFWSWYHARGL